MNIAKHMEAVFVAALAFAGSASLIVDTIPEAHARPAVVSSNHIATPDKMAVVTVQASRMSEAEKVQSLLEERKIARSGI